MTNNDAWLKVLEQRVEELQLKCDTCNRAITKAVARFKEWVQMTDDLEIVYDAKYQAERLTKAKETYHAAWQELNKAKAELQDYKGTMGF